MTRLRLSVIAATLLAATACDSTTPTFTAKPDDRGAHYDGVEVDSLLEGGGWAGSGHGSVSSDTTGRGGGGWAGSGH